MKPHLERKYKDIKADYNALYLSGLRHEEIRIQLAEEYYMSPVSIENIVWGIGGYAKTEKKDL